MKLYPYQKEIVEMLRRMDIENVKFIIMMPARRSPLSAQSRKGCLTNANR